MNRTCTSYVTLHLRAGVGINFAVQADFFELRCRPFHIFLLSKIHFSRMPPT
jgi:hypothetical protein